MTLTEKYRLVWSDDKVLISDPFEEYPSNTETIVGAGMNSFQAQTIPAIENKIASEELFYKGEL